jgi:predicted amidohydrolase
VTTALPRWSDAIPARATVGALQWAQRRVGGFEDFANDLSDWVRVAGDYGVELLVLPELITCQLLSAEPARLEAADALNRLSDHTPAWTALLSALAKQHRLTLVGGTHLTWIDGRPRNVCWVATPDGALQRRDKLHITPSEAGSWAVEGGDARDVAPVDTPVGKIGVQVCYDSEFPELGRAQVDAGAWLFAIPYCTDLPGGHRRVRYSAQARAVENQVYVAAAGNAGFCPGVANFDQQYAESAILTPCDDAISAFAPDGIARAAAPGIAQLLVAELDATALKRARERGSVRNLIDRRPDLYAALRGA